MAAPDIAIDNKVFQERITQFVNSWKADLRSGANVFNGATAMVILMGKIEESPEYYKNNAVHFWLLGYEFPTTLMVFTTEKLYIVTTPKKAKHLDQIKGGKFPIEILVRGKDLVENEKQFVQLIEVIKAAGNKVAVLTKDSSKGAFVDDWKKTWAEHGKGVDEIDAAAALSTYALAVKDEPELRLMRAASKACVALMNPFFLEEITSILDAEKKVKHSELADRIDQKLDDANFWKTVELPNKAKLPKDLDSSQLDWTLGPVIQSGKYDLKMASQANTDPLHAGIIIAAMGLRYKQYCSNIGRTYLVDPNKSQESTYKLLWSIHTAVINEIRDGISASQAYAKAISIIKSKRPELEKNFVKNVGWGIGLETKDPFFMLTAKNTRILRDGMTFCINTGFSDVENSQAQDKARKHYSLIITDTIRVQKGSEPVVFTGDAPIDADANSFFFKDDDESAPAASSSRREKKDSRVGAVATKNITQTRLRSERTTQVDEESEKKRREHQKSLANRKQREGLERFAEATGNGNGVEAKKFKRFESYKRDNQFPPKVRDQSIIVDTKTGTIIVPLMGRPVPFHINTIKNASKSDEGEWSYLRINLLSPGQGVGRKDDQPFEDASAHFVRSLTFRSTNGDRYSEIAGQIANLKRDAAKKEQEQKDMEDVVEQEKLIEIRNRRPQVLDNVFLRPADGKRVVGKVEIHQNGLRYQSPLNPSHRVDVLFSNIRHLFFQPCQHELFVVIHIYLITPIMIGNKKKTRDVQFYREATDIQFDETGNRKRKYRYGDEDEFEAEQDERRRRTELDRLFQAFAGKIAEVGKDAELEVDMPIREIGFYGVPNRSNVYIQPTTDCLVQLIEQPFVVITIQDIEVAHLERVQFGLKNFDLVLVFKDFSRAPFHINTIPVEYLDRVKEWLDSSDIAFSEGPLNLNWPTIMKTVTADTHLFFKDGGWAFLQADSDEEAGSDDEEDEESDFQIDEDELDEASESSEEDSEYGSAVSEEDEEEDEDESEEGEDWDELEKKARKRDREAGQEEEEEDRSGRKKRKN